MSELHALYLNLTTACNIRCRHCFIDAGRPQPKEMSFEQIESILIDAAQLGTRKVTFTGGEPTIHPHFSRLLTIAASLKGNGIDQLALVTNGMLLNRELSETIAGIIDVVNVSIDGLPVEHDALRGQGSFEETLKGLRLLVRAGIDPTIFITITEQTKDSIDELIRLLYQSEGVHKFKVRSIWNFGRATRYPHLFPAEDQQLGPSKARPSINKSEERSGLGYSVNVHPDGLVYPCHLLRYPEYVLGNLTEQKLADVYHGSSLLQSLRDLDITCCQHVGYSREVIADLIKVNCSVNATG